jgi:hypothetical protein
MLFNYLNFIEESYLDSNFAPLYHRTTTYGIFDIISSDVLKMTDFENLFNGDKIKMVSLTRNKNLNLDYYKPFLDVIIELDVNELRKKYKILKYYFFIHSKKEDKPKSNIYRQEPFEFEEIILKDVKNISDYIISVNFEDNSILDRQVASIIPILRNKKIKIYNNVQEY